MRPALWLFLVAAASWTSTLSAAISPDELSRTVQTLASDEFLGRAPGTPGDDLTVAYLVARLKAIGLEPAGPKGAWTQSVPMLHVIPGEPENLVISTGRVKLAPIVGKDITLTTVRESSHLQVRDAPIIFVGYGVTAPERRWDDYKGVDLRGKIALILVNDPDFGAAPEEPVAGRFAGRTMTYYGRWIYKLEEATRQGALGALIIHETEAAGWGWNVALSTALGGTYSLRRSVEQQPLAVQGFVSAAFAENLLTNAGLDWTQLKRQARSEKFKPVTLPGARFSMEMAAKYRRIESNNVLAKISGAIHPSETVLLGAHWDGVGIGPADEQGRTIRAGANDDAVGVAGLLAIAEQLKRGPRPDRSITFGFWTAEERGLLGSEYFASQPTMALETTVANLTIDTMQTAGLARDIVLIGAGQNNLDAELATAAARQGRAVTPDPRPERGLMYRADHFPFAKRGVPTLLLMGIGGGVDLFAGGRTAGENWVSDYVSRCYHQPCDRWSEHWDLRGAAQDIELLLAVTRRLAGSRDWPTWVAGSEFEKIRDSTCAARPGMCKPASVR